MKRILLIASLLLIILITFIEAYDARNVENLSYIIAIGIDKSDSEDEPLSLTIQIAKPDTSEGNGTKIKSELSTVQCNSFNLGLAMLNLANVNELNLSHCSVIIISEDVAKEGIGDFINTIANNIEIRPTCNVLISQNKAKEYLEVTSKLEDISSKFYNSYIKSAEITSYVTPCKLSDFYSSLHQDVKTPVALYSFVKEDNIESLGLAVFKDYKMVGRLSGLDTICYNILTNNFKQATIEVYNPQEPSLALSVAISHDKNTDINVKLENGIPKITCNVKIKSTVLTGNKNFDYSTENSLKEIESEINKFLTQNITAFLYQTSREYKSDIIGFEGFFKRNFLTEDELNKYDWEKLYEKAEFKVETENYLKSGFLFSKN